jgi:hexosaminidase
VFADTDAKLSLSGIRSIIVDSKFANYTNTKGETLIPPSLQEFGETFAKDLRGLHVNVSCHTGTKSSNSSIFLTLGEPGDYLDVAGRESAEGYSLSVSNEGIEIAGASSLGAWWGTRTILQQVSLL